MATAATTKQPRITFDELQKTAAWGDLSAKQRFFVETWIATASDGMKESERRVFSVKSAYDVASDETARVLSYQFLESPNVKAVLALYFGDLEATPEGRRESFLIWLEKAIKRGKLTQADKDAIRFLFDQRGWKVPEGVHGDLRTNGYTPAADREPKSAPSPKFKVGDIATDNAGKKWRITKLNEEGLPAEGDPIEE